MPPAFIAAVILVFGVVGTLMYLQWQADKKRRAALLNFARARGWTLTPAADEWAERWSVEPFGEGDDRKARNVIQGSIGAWPMVAFDFSYETHSSDSKGNSTTTVHRFAVSALQLPIILPDLCVTQENVFTRIGSAIGFADVELESEDFNRRFRVKASVTKFAYDVLNARTMELLLARPALSWRIDGASMLTWSSGTLDVPRLLAQLDTAQSVLAGIPPFVWKDAGAPEPTPP
jgi:hypothetical protein